MEKKCRVVFRIDKSFPWILSGQYHDKIDYDIRQQQQQQQQQKQRQHQQQKQQKCMIPLLQWHENVELNEQEPLFKQGFSAQVISET